MRPRTLAVDPSGAHLLVGFTSGAVKLLDPSTFDDIATFKVRPDLKYRLVATTSISNLPFRPSLVEQTAWLSGATGATLAKERDIWWKGSQGA